MQHEGRADFVPQINPNAELKPSNPEDFSPVEPEMASAQLANNTTTNPDLPQDQIQAPVQANMDIPYGSPFGTPMGGVHQELHELASQTAPPDTSGDIRSQLIEILKELQNQANFLQVIAEENPPLYEAMNGLVQMVIQMARGNGLSKSAPKGPVDTIVESLKGMYPQHDCKKGDCYYATEAMYHLLGGKEAGYVPFVNNAHWFLKSSTGKVVDPTGPGSQMGQPKQLVTSQPSLKAVGLIDTLIRQAPLKKYAVGDQTVNNPGDTSKKVGRTYLQLPIGTTKGIKIKVLHRNGSTGWRQVQAGMVQGLEPDVPLLSANSHPVSVKRPFDE